MSTQQIVILGNGIAGITAARHVRKHSDHEITVVSAESDHFFSRTALMYVYMGHMSYEHTKPYEDWFWEKNRIRLVRAWAEAVEIDAKRLRLAAGRHLPYDALLVATGSKSNKFGWPGQDLHGVQGLYSLQDLEQMEAWTQGVRRAVIVGGGLIGVEMAEMLHSRGIEVTFLVREQSWMDFVFPAEESALIGRHVKSRGIDLRLGAELDRILADERGRARAVLTKTGEEIVCQFVGLTVGVSPNVDLLRASGLECERGVLADSYLRTSAADVYAAGDCVQLRAPKPGRRPIEPLWYTGRMMGETVAKALCGEPTEYDPGLWFNSAKFFDLEYQVYGDVPVKPRDGEATLYWEHPGGEKSIRINYRESDGAVLGFNLMGVRYRHEVCEEWIRAGRPVRWVLENLAVANFDPEFYAQHERDLLQIYNRRHPEAPVELRRKRGLRSLFALRKAS